MSENRAEEQVAVALEYVQGKRRLEHVVQAANALGDKFAGVDDATERVRLTYELLRRNFADNVRIDFRAAQFATTGEAPENPAATASVDLIVSGKTVGTVALGYTPPGKLGLTPTEWKSAVELLTTLLAIGVGGHSRWNR